MKVLMLGGRRCGKTSVLAAMFDQMRNGQVNNYLTMRDTTVRETKTGVFDGEEITETTDNLLDKINELRAFFNQAHNSSFIIDQAPTHFDWKYTMRLQKSGDNKMMDIDFLDIPGEWCNRNETKHFQWVTDTISQGCDVVVVVIDTPYLMEARDFENYGANRVDDIHDLLTSLQDTDDAKMILFVPVKCEKWYKEGRIDEVTNKVQTVYDASIKHLMNMERATVCIMPVLTAGNILFQELKPAKYIIGPNIRNSAGERVKLKCAQLSDTLFRLQDGRIHEREDEDKCDDDSNAFITGTREHPGGILRPYEWFTISQESSIFEPKNCEQLPIHILVFLLNKLDALRERQSDLSRQQHQGNLLVRIYNAIANLITKLVNIIRRVMGNFGDLGESGVRDIVRRICQDGLFVENKDGIKYLKRDY